MTGVPLTAADGIAAEGGAAADAKGGGAEMQHDDAREAEVLARQTAEAAQGDGAEGTARTAETPSNDAERAVVAVDTAVAAPTS
jgi:hypothetical protein